MIVGATTGLSACRDVDPGDGAATIQGLGDQTSIIAAKASALGSNFTGAANGNLTTLNSPVTGQFGAFTAQYQAYANGAIVASDAHLAVWVPLAIFNKWLVLKNDTNYYGSNLLTAIGLPTADAGTLKGAPSVTFERGVIVDFNGAKAVYGDIYRRYRTLNETAGAPDLGLPTDQEWTGANLGRYQVFQYGEIDWSYAPDTSDPTRIPAPFPPIDAWEMVPGPILDAWVAGGHGESPVRYPKGPPNIVRNQAGTEIGRWQHFELGNLYYSAATGLSNVSNDDNTEYWRWGGPTGFQTSPNPALGFPVGNRNITAMGTGYQQFENGIIAALGSGPNAGERHTFTNPTFHIGTLSSGGSDCWLCGNLDAYWHVVVTQITPAPQKEIYHFNWGRAGTIVANESHSGGFPKFTPDLWIRTAFYGSDIDDTSMNDNFSARTRDYNIDNLWGTYFDPVHVITDDSDPTVELSAEYLIQSRLPYDPTDILNNEWWSFQNFSTNDLPKSTFAMTFGDVDSPLVSLYSNAFYDIVYRSAANGGNCFGMDLEAIYSMRGLSSWAEPLHQWFSDTQDGVKLDASPGSLADELHQRMATTINVKQGYQLDDEVVARFANAFWRGEQHNPNKQFQWGQGYQASGQPVIVSMTDDYLFGAAHAVLATKFDDNTPCVDPYPTNHQCARIYILNPNLPSALIARFRTAPKDFIQIDKTANSYYYADAAYGPPLVANGTPLVYQGTDSMTPSHNGRLWVVPYGLLDHQPSLPTKIWRELYDAGLLIVLASNGAMAQATDAAGHTLFKTGGVSQLPLWTDLQPDPASAIALAPLPLASYDGYQTFQRYGAKYLTGAKQTYDLTIAPNFPDTTAYTALIETGRQSSLLVIPGTLGVPEKVTVSNIGMDSAATQLAIPTTSRSKAVKWTISGVEKNRWAEFSNLTLAPGQNVTMDTHQGGQLVAVTNSGAQTSASLRVSQGPNQPPIDAGVVVLPNGRTVVNVATTVPWTIDSLKPAAWYVASSNDVTVTTTGMKWTDRSGNNRHATQTVAGNMPQLKATGWNGTQPTMSFDGSDLLRYDAWSGAPSGTDVGFTVLAVMRPAAAQDAAVAGWWDVNGGGVAWASVKSSSGETLLEMTRFSNQGTGQMQAGALDLGTGRHVVGWRYSPKTQSTTLVVDGAFATSASLPSAGSLPNMPFIIGAKSLLPTGMFTGDISELMVVPSNLSDADILNFTNYARQKWGGLPAQPPAGPCTTANGQPAPSTTRCDDGNASTFGDHCSSGACVGTVPASGSPADLSPTAWYHAGSPEVVVTEGGVSTWFDRTTHHLDLVQTILAGRPALAASGWNGNKPTVTFNGGNLLRRNAWTGAPTGEDAAFTVLAVMRSSKSQTASVASWWNANSAGKIGCQIKPSGTSTVLDLFRSDNASATQELTGTTNIGTGRHVVVWRYSPEVLKITLDGTTTTSASKPSLGTITPDAFLMGAASYFPSGLLSGDISELAIVSGSLSDTAVANFRTYAKAEWGGLP